MLPPIPAALVAADLVAADLRERLAAARAQTDRLFALVRPGALYERPVAERHRLVFYRGHLEAFDWNLLREPLLDARSFAPDLDRLFAFGIDPVGTALPSDQPDDWPPIDEIERYNERLRDIIDASLIALASRIDCAAKPADDDPRTLINMAIEHRLMHAETLAYLLHRLPPGDKRAQTQPDPVVRAPRVDSMVEIPASTATIGLERGTAFGWDNEFEAHTVEVPAFAIDRFMVSNGEFLRFVEAGGYDDRALWSAADWRWKSSQAIAHPAFWTRGTEGWLWRGMFGERPLPADWPVYASHAEASAYAAWAGKALPTEAQWQRAATGLSAFVTDSGGRDNVDFRRWDPVSVAAPEQHPSRFGVVGLRGNGWEWTASEFAPLPGFRASPHYRGYSADFFDGRHFVLKGGSPRTAACLGRLSFRNWFQPHYPHVYAGFRCVTRQR
jgi:ergothioneine biosynthesis protein EgtB